MRGRLDKHLKFCFSIDIEQRIRSGHALQPIKLVDDRILDRKSNRFAAAYSSGGLPSVPPERLLKAHLLMVLYSVSSARQLAEFINTDLLFRWLLDMDPVEPTARGYDPDSQPFRGRCARAHRRLL